jgi:hypothetical protein
MTPAARVDAWSTFPARLAVAARAAMGGPVPDGEWGPAEVVRHLIAVEREVLQARLTSLENEVEPGWSWTEPGLEPGLEDAPLDAILERFAAARARSVAIVAGFDDAAWARTGIHDTFGRLDVAGLIGITADHDDEHLAGLGGTAVQIKPRAPRAGGA